MIRCVLDEDGCIDLQSVLRVVNQINLEQVWASCHQLASLMQRLAPIESLAQIYLHKDGFIHEKSLIASQQTKAPRLNENLRRRPAMSETELVASLGIALYWALDHGIPDDEERKLTDTMECLIRRSLDEKLSLDEVMDYCLNRLPLETKSHAETHYRGVLKSLVSDTLELSIFLEKIYTASMVLSDITLDGEHHHGIHNCDIEENVLSEFGEPLASLRALRINDWARLWMQVIRELRQRGRFKQALSVN